MPVLPKRGKVMGQMDGTFATFCWSRGPQYVVKLQFIGSGPNGRHIEKAKLRAGLLQIKCGPWFIKILFSMSECGLLNTECRLPNFTFSYNSS